MASIYQEQAKLFKALGDPRRLQILELLRSGEKCACVLLDHMQMPQSSLSYHMKILCDSGIVEGRPDGKWMHYHISPFGSEIAIALLRQITAVDEQPCACESCNQTKAI